MSNENELVTGVETAERQTAAPETVAELKSEEAAARAENVRLWKIEADKTLDAGKPLDMQAARQAIGPVIQERPAIDSVLVAKLKADDDEARAKTAALVAETARGVAERKAAREAQRALERANAILDEYRAKGFTTMMEPKAHKPAKPSKQDKLVKECCVWHVGKNWHVAKDKANKTYRVADSKLEGMRIALSLGYTHCLGANYDGKLASMARWAHFRVPAKS